MKPKLKRGKPSKNVSNRGKFVKDEKFKKKGQKPKFGAQNAKSKVRDAHEKSKNAKKTKKKIGHFKPKSQEIVKKVPNTNIVTQRIKNQSFKAKKGSQDPKKFNRKPQTAPSCKAPKLVDVAPKASDVSDAKKQKFKTLKTQKNKVDKQTLKKVKKESQKPKERSFDDEEKKIKLIYSKLLLEHRNASKCETNIANALELVKEPLQITKRHVSKLLQACLKYGDPNIRLEIFNRFKSSSGFNILNAASTAFITKLYHYCDANIQSYLKDALFQLTPLLFTRYGGTLIDSIYAKEKPKDQIAFLKHYCVSNNVLLETSPAQLKAINTFAQFMEFLKDEKWRKSCLDKLQQNVEKLLNKQLISTSIAHDLLLIYIDLGGNKEFLMTGCATLFGQLLSTKSGNTVLCKILGYANAKTKKHLIMRLKADFPDAAYNAINVLVLTRLVSCTDDTVWVGKHIIQPLLNNLDEVVYDANAHKLLLTCLEAPEPKDAPQSLKDHETRKQQLLQQTLEPLVQWFKGLKEGNKDKDFGKSLSSAISDKYASECLKVAVRLSVDAELVEKVIAAFSQCLEDSQGVALKTIQALVKPKGAISSALVKLKPWVQVWNEILKPNLQLVYSSRLVFLLINVLEACIENGHELASEIKRCVSVDEIETLINKDATRQGIQVLHKLVKDTVDA